jgi:adenylate cyclase
VYGQALSEIADADVRLFHLYVHEPLIRDGVPSLQMAAEMEDLAADLLPLASPLMDYIHRRFLQQGVVGHMEIELAEELDLRRLRVGIAFCDLAGYTRFIEEEGEEEALSFVESFIEAVTWSLAEGARVVKTIGDEVMIVGQDVRALVDPAVGFQRLFPDRPQPRIGITYGATLYRDGDYLGREVNVASRVARARGGEVLVTDSVVEAFGRGGGHVEFEGIGQVKLKGFDQPRRLCRAMARE